MKRACSTWATALAVSLSFAQGCDEGVCPPGSRLFGTRCALVDAELGQPEPARERVACPHELSAGEGCAEAASSSTDGCASRCESDGCAESDACSPPATPVLTGAASMAPERVLWAWQPLEEGAELEGRLDGVPLADLSHQTHFTPALALGPHTLALRACGPRGPCSPWAVHETVVESFAPAAPRALRDLARTIACTAIGRPVAVGCADCAGAPGAGPQALDTASAQLERAHEQGADVLQLAVAQAGGQLRGAPGASADEQAPLLASVFALEVLRTSSALLLLDIAGPELGAATQPPSQFAGQLFALLDAEPRLARNGRPLWLRTGLAHRDYLEALFEESRAHPVTGPYVRFLLRDRGEDPAAFYAAAADPDDGPLVAGAPFVDAVSIDFRASNLAYRMARSRRASRAVIVEHLPEPEQLAEHAEAVLAALRDQADVLLTTYPVERARAVVQDANVEYYIDGRSMADDAEQVHAERADRAGAPAQSLAPPSNGSTPPAEIVQALSVGAGLLPPYLAVCPGCGLLLTGAPLPLAASAPGALLSYFGTIPGAPSSTTYDILLASERASLARIADEFVIQPAMGAHAAGLAPSWTIETRKLLAACVGEPISAAELAANPHWIIAFSTDGSRWSIMLDGRCTLESAPIAPIESAAALGSFVTVNQAAAPRAVQAAGVLRWPTEADATGPR